ncbi:hypothetical protein ACQEU5_04870 [Marinactinospora thermotolerans]|uniref:Uncharacterized protein n=1 Tax=Marinactinospora thermotolerans DSM 45154 TaxID=1122192 RepID=A0A1T4QJF2_9ACTN|nr:hypothetical protein [Marinactinospora thermotolerans]SKA03804.1 hypothetical protein SAMN02745673_02267 [Marinactinospora thermotolerans DSM 45154]
MAENTRDTRFIRGSQAEGGAFAPTNSHRGRGRSWIAVAVILVAFVLIAVSLTLGPAWWLLGIGVALMVVGGVLCLVTDIFTDVVLDEPRYEPEEPHSTPLHRIKQGK